MTLALRRLAALAPLPLPAVSFGHRAELAANGLDRRLLSDRDDSVDAGVRATYHCALGVITFEGLHDVGSVSDGYEISFDHHYTSQLAQDTLTASHA